MFNLFKKTGNIFEEMSPEARRDFYREYGDVMREAREQKGILLSDLAAVLQIAEEELAEYEAGKTVPLAEGIAIFEYLKMRKLVFSVY